MRVTHDADIETARREVMTARGTAIANRDWAEMNRLTQILATFPVKTSTGAYQAVPRG